MQINTVHAPTLQVNMERAAELAVTLAPERAVALEQMMGAGVVPANPVVEPYTHGAYMAGLVAALFEVAERQQQELEDLRRELDEQTKED